MAEMVNLESSDTAKDNIEKLKAIFPDIVRDGEVNFKALQLLLGEEIATDNESYKFEWVGKKNCYKSIQTPSNGTLKYVKEDSLNPDTSENLIIEGDNLEVLKLLQSSYKNSIKMIYIDPPYNTGNDFVYPDNFKTPLENYLEITGQKVGGETTQSKKSKEGRKHTQWLNMIFPRLLLSRTLLKDDGIICISIDNSEVNNLQTICDEVFGEENQIGYFIWKNKHGGGGDNPHIVQENEYILVYAKNLSTIPEFFGKPAANYYKLFRYEDERGKYYLDRLDKKGIDQNRPNLIYPIECPDGSIKDISPAIWRLSKEEFEQRKKQGLVEFKKDKEGVYQIYTKTYMYDEDGNLRKVRPRSILKQEVVGFTQNGNKEIVNLFGKKVFDNPKPVDLLKYLYDIQLDDNDIVLDFFGGSGTTGQAILELNNEENKDIKFILVQLQEVLDPKKKGQKVAYEFLKSIKKPTVISEITKERVRRVINGYGENPKPLDGGFKVFKLDKSNYKINEAINVKKDSDKDEIIKKLRQQFKTSTVYDESMVDGYTELNVIYENILKEGYSLNSHIEVIEDITECKIYKIIDNVKKSKVFYITFDKVDTEITTHKEFAGISNDTLFICFDNNLSDSDKQNLSKTFRLKTM